MNSRHDPYDFVGIGLYTLADAAALLRASPRTIRRWMIGYSYKTGDAVHPVPALWEPDIRQFDGQIELSFRDLIELRFVLAFVETGVGLPAIRNCLSLAKQVLQSDRPFLSGRFRTDGKTIFLESLGSMPGEASVLDLRNGQLAFKTVIERTFRDLDLEDNSVSRWRPFGGKPSIVIDPKRSFGQPIATLSGVPTITLAESVKAEGSISRVAAIFDISRSAVQDAVKFHEELLAA